jgi:hypothetical protein
MITIIQQILAGLVTTGVLGWLYIRMIKRDKPSQIGVPLPGLHFLCRLAGAVDHAEGM